MKFISEKQANSILKVALGTGADFAELFLEHTIDNSLQMIGGEIARANSNIKHGASVRILLGSREVFGYVNDWSVASLKALAKKLRASIKSPNHLEVEEFKPENKRDIVNPVKLPHKVTNKTKVVSIAHITNVVGDIRDIKSIAKVCHNNNILLVVTCEYQDLHIVYYYVIYK